MNDPNTKYVVSLSTQQWDLVVLALGKIHDMAATNVSGLPQIDALAQPGESLRGLQRADFLLRWSQVRRVLSGRREAEARREGSVARTQNATGPRGVPVILQSPFFYDERSAHAMVESLRWPDGPVCPRCDGRRCGPLRGDSTRIGVQKCYDCRKPFTVKIGTMFESSHVPLHLWLQAIFLISSAKRKVSCYTLQRTLGVSIRTAWSMRRAITDSTV